MNIPQPIRPFWDGYQATLASDVSARYHDTFYFADTQQVADDLAALVLAGTKRATAALLWSHEAEGSQPPAVGSLSIMTDFSGAPLAILEVTATNIVAFEDVSADFAAREGEGDGSLRYWRDVHWAYFSRECASIGRDPSLRMPVVCEEFVVVHPAEAADRA